MTGAQGLVVSLARWTAAVGFVAGCAPQEIPLASPSQQKSLHVACERGDAHACRQRGHMTAEGRLTIPSENQRRRYLELGCAHQDGASCAALADALSTSNDTKPKANVYRQKACEYGHRMACETLATPVQAEALSTGYTDDVAADINSHAIEPLSHGCQQGAALSCLELGGLYQTGDGVARDRSKALTLFEQACEHDEPEGCSNAADMYRSGWDVPLRPARAAKLYQRGCESGYAKACRELSRLYKRGRGVSQDRLKAAELMRRACDLGSTSACDRMKARNQRRAATRL